MDIDTLQRIAARALAIKTQAEAAGRNFTLDEVAELEGLFASFDVADQMLDQQPVGRRIAKPDTRIGTSMPGETTSAYLDDSAGEYFAMASGERIPAYRPHEPLAGPRDRRPFNLARVAAAAWSGDWSRCGPELQVMAAAQSGLTGASGQFMVPEFLSREIVDLARAQSKAISSGVRTISMPASEMRIAKVLSDPTVHWRPELHPIQQSSITLGEVTLSAKTAGTYLIASEELLQDAPNADQLFRRLMSEALAAEMDRVIFAGSGTNSQPEGILNNSSVPQAILSGKQSNFDLFINLVTSLQVANGSPDTIVMSPQIAGSLAKLKDSQGNPLTSPQVWSELRKLVSNRLPAGGGSPSNWPAILGGFEEVVLGVRLPIQLAVANAGGADSDWGDGSPQLSGDAFQRYALRFRCVMRLDVAILRPQLLTNIHGLEP